MLTEKFDAALLFAADLHRKQARKGTGTPYFGHLLAVAALVIDDGGSEDEAIGALLHDSIEDQGQHYPGGREALRTYIREQFGSAVADIVDACTDDEGLSKESMGTPQEDRARWLERKQAYVDGIGHKTRSTMLNRSLTLIPRSDPKSGIAFEPGPVRTKRTSMRPYRGPLIRGTGRWLHPNGPGCRSGFCGPWVS